MEKIDAHQHFWVFDELRDSWITPDMEAIRRNFLPEYLVPELKSSQIAACVAVQADQSETETRFLVDLASKHHFIRGVVGWVDITSPGLSGRLDEFSQYSIIRGYRHIVQSEAPGFMDREDFRRGLGELSRRNLTYDILIRAEQLPEAIRLVRDFPNQRFVLDHAGKPQIKDAMFEPWATHLQELASFRNVYCKLSGLVTEADHRTWKRDDIYYYIDWAFTCFSADRLMFGSDWPVCKLAAGYQEVASLADDFISTLSVREQERVWGETARDFYNLDRSL